ncbi:MAG: ErfK/YbiS/YcfS/YnhG family protein [Xanthobacteraceae bacterium]|nr:ErfK/YbiS/YcfS/YnhG family protein [Xanthobacteraceae bacterium]
MTAQDLPRLLGLTAALATTFFVSLSGAANAQAFATAEPSARRVFEQVIPYERTLAPEPGEGAPLNADLRRQIVLDPTGEKPGTIVVDTANTHLYLVLPGGRAMRYGIGVGREGFTWSGVANVSRKTEWPDWTPPVEMIERQPYLPRWMAGGPGNPLGARAMYLGSSLYRIHGTNDPTTIGQNVSSGCIRLTNDDVADLYERVGVGAKVVVLKEAPRWAGARPRDHARHEVIQPSRAASAVSANRMTFGGLY